MLNTSRSKNSAHKGSSQERGWGKRGLLVPIPPSIPAFYANVLRISSRVPSEDCVTSQRSSAWEATPNPPRSRELFALLSDYRNENMIEVRPYSHLLMKVLAPQSEIMLITSPA